MVHIVAEESARAHGSPFAASLELLRMLTYEEHVAQTVYSTTEQEKFSTVYVL